MKDKKLVTAAIKAKVDGFEFIYSLVMIKDGRRLYNVNSINDILFRGNWQASTPKVVKDDKGITATVINVTDRLPPKSISRTEVLRKYGK